MQTFTFYMSFDDGSKLTASVQAYSLLSAVMQARTRAFDMVNRIWKNEGRRLVLTDYMVK